MKLRHILIALTAVVVTPAIVAKNVQAEKEIKFKIEVNQAFLDSSNSNGDAPQLLYGPKAEVATVDGGTQILFADRSLPASGYASGNSSSLGQLMFEYGRNEANVVGCGNIQVKAGDTLQVTGAGQYPNDPFVCSLKK